MAENKELLQGPLVSISLADFPHLPTIPCTNISALFGGCTKQLINDLTLTSFQHLKK